MVRTPKAAWQRGGGSFGAGRGRTSEKGGGVWRLVGEALRQVGAGEWGWPS